MAALKETWQKSSTWTASGKFCHLTLVQLKKLGYSMLDLQESFLPFTAFTPFNSFTESSLS